MVPESAKDISNLKNPSSTKSTLTLNNTVPMCTAVDSTVHDCKACAGWKHLIHPIIRWLLVMGLVLTTAIAAIGTVQAATITVCSSGCGYSDIQTAINAANVGDTIEVKSGIYYENVNINKQLILRGIDTGSGMPVVDAAGSGSSITISAGGSVVNSFYVTGSGSEWGEAGIRITSENNEIVNNTIENNYNGIFFEEPYGEYSSSNNTVTENIVCYNNYKGIYVYRSHYNIITNNTASSNINDGISFGHSSQNQLTNNIASSNKDDGISLSEDSDYNTLTNNTANFNYETGIGLYKSSNNIFVGNNVSGNEDGIGLDEGNNNTFIDNTANSNTDCGIYLDSLSSYNTILNNNISLNNDDGINFDDSFYNTISGNIILNNSDGIDLEHSSNNTINNNIVSFNRDDGIELVDSANNNMLIGNTLSLNEDTGIAIKLSNNNQIYHNNFLDNSDQADDDSSNFWDNGYAVGGNYWSDYTGVDSDGDGIGDTVYSIDGGSAVDHYPLTVPWPMDTDTSPPVVTITSPIDGATVSTSSITVTGTATDDTGVTTLTVNGNSVTVESDGPFTTTVSLTSGVNTIIVIATDAAGNSASESVNVTAELPYLVFAITPNSRLAQVGTPVTIFMSVINAGTGSATDVSISQASSLPATISYQAWDGATLTGTPDTPVDIGSGETANFVLTINPTADFTSSAMTFDVSGTNGGSAPISGVNTLTMAASATPYADVIMISTSLDVSTAVNTATAFALATTNVGTASATDVSLVVDIPFSITGLSYQVNETNPDGSIKGPAAGLTIPVGGCPTFAVFLTPTQAIDYDPANNRIVLKLVDGSGKVIGAQSVAVSTA